jgi:transposase
VCCHASPASLCTTRGHRTTPTSPPNTSCVARTPQGELQGVLDNTTDSGWCWAEQSRDALVALERLVAEAVEHAMATNTAVVPDKAVVAEQVRLYRDAARIGVADTAARGTELMKKRNALARRLLNRQDDYLRFTVDHRIPPDNNGSERDIRMIELRQKVSGALRTLTGAQQFCVIRSYLSTAAKHGTQFLEVLAMLAEGRPWMPA